MSYTKPQDGLFVFDTKDDFAEFYGDHKQSIDESEWNESIVIKFFCPNGKEKILGIPDKNDDLDQLLDDLPENTKVELIEKIRVFDD